MKTTFYKHPYFIIGTLVLVSIIIASFLLNYVYVPKPSNTPWVLDSKGRYIATNPYKPSPKHILGTDAKGNDLLVKLIQGAQFTLIIALLAGFARVFISLIIGVLLSTILRPIKKILYPIVDSFHYAPAALLIYVVVAPIVVVYSWAFDTKTKIIFILSSLILVAVPSLSLFISDELDSMKKEEFIQSAKLLGGGAFHNIRKHYWPHIKSKLIILMTQHYVQIMLLFAHLGLLGLYLSGTKTGPDHPPSPTFGPAAHNKIPNGFHFIGNDWGGMLAQAKDDFGIHPWLIWGPCLAFTITILALTGILESFKSNYKYQRRHRTKKRTHSNTPPVIAENDFILEVKTGT